MTHQTQQKRIAGVKLARAVNAIEGAPVSSYANNLSVRWARGEITGKQMKSMLIASHKKPESAAKKP